jgi:hypothetical protein
MKIRSTVLGSFHALHTYRQKHIGRRNSVATPPASSIYNAYEPFEFCSDRGRRESGVGCEIETLYLKREVHLREDTTLGGEKGLSFGL